MSVALFAFFTRKSCRSVAVALSNFLRFGTLTCLRSGELNAKNRELMELQALAQRRLKNNRANFADGMKAAKEVKKDLEWTQKRVK